MLVTFISQCEKKAHNRTRRVLDAFANRIGNNTWQTPITEEGLDAVKKLLRQTASKNTAVSCHQLKSRVRTELLWVVGNRDKFNSEGVVAVNHTEQDRFIGEREGWKYLPQIQELAVFAALLHDFGKASVLFQNKLHGKNKTKGDPIRHEWVSVLFLVAIVNGKSDKEWLDSLISDEVHKTIKKLKIDNIDNPLKNLPSIASMIAWLILTHHKMPCPIEKNNAEKPIKLIQLLALISQKWGYENANQDELEKCFQYKELPSKSIEWQGRIKEYAIKLSNNLSTLEHIFNSDNLRIILSYARLCLMLGDHYYSSLKRSETEQWYSSLELYANTDNNGVKQKLDEHLVRVAQQTEKNTKKLPAFEGLFNQNIRIIDNKKLAEKITDNNFKWQDKAVNKIEKWREKEKNLDKYQFGFFAINIASTGKGKTLANAKIMQALSPNEDSLRYILALGLRTLTLQTGDEYKNRIGLTNTELAVLIGSKAILNLHNQDNSNNDLYNQDDTGSESSETLNDKAIIFDKDFPEQGLDTVLRNKKDRQFLYAPVLACTIDHIILATETTRGGKYILPTLRLMSSDLVIDEIDDFDDKDLIAIGRLIHLSGMLGRKVMLSSATISPDLAEGYFNVYQSGWQIFSKMRDKNSAIGCAWIDEFQDNITVKTISNIDDYCKQHEKFIKKRLKKLNNEKVKRKANIAQCNTNLNNYFTSIQQEIINKHNQHNFIDKQTGKKISIGVVRMANIKPCIELTKYLLNSSLVEDIEIKAMAYHSRQVLLMRHTQEKYLDKILKRKNGNAHILEDEIIRTHIDNSTTKNIIFVLVATPVEEVGRDHDFDWAVIEPSSYRSFIQMAGRVLRHRSIEKDIIHPNIAIMQYNYRALKTKGNKVAFRYPGYQRTMNDLDSYDLKKLVDVDGLAEKLDASHRIQKLKQLNSTINLANLEHKVIAELLTNYSQKGAATMQGWLDDAWWLSGVHQQFIKFRNSNPDMIQFLTLESGFGEKSKIGKHVPQNNIKTYKLGANELENLWLSRNYKDLLKALAKGKDLEKTALIYGEITLPVYYDSNGKPKLTENQFSYNEQLGLTETD